MYLCMYGPCMYGFMYVRICARSANLTLAASYPILSHLSPSHSEYMCRTGEIHKYVYIYLSSRIPSIYVISTYYPYSASPIPIGIHPLCTTPPATRMHGYKPQRTEVSINPPIHTSLLSSVVNFPSMHFVQRAQETPRRGNNKSIKQ